MEYIHAKSNTFAAVLRAGAVKRGNSMCLGLQPMCVQRRDWNRSRKDIRKQREGYTCICMSSARSNSSGFCFYTFALCVSVVCVWVAFGTCGIRGICIALKCFHSFYCMLGPIRQRNVLGIEGKRKFEVKSKHKRCSTLCTVIYVMCTVLLTFTIYHTT